MKRISAILIGACTLVGISSAMALEGSREPSLNPNNLSQLLRSNHWILRSSSKSGKCSKIDHSRNQNWTKKSKELMRKSFHDLRRISFSEPQKVNYSKTKCPTITCHGSVLDSAKMAW